MSLVAVAHMVLSRHASLYVLAKCEQLEHASAELTGGSVLTGDLRTQSYWLADNFRFTVTFCIFWQQGILHPCYIGTSIVRKEFRGRVLGFGKRVSGFTEAARKQQLSLNLSSAVGVAADESDRTPKRSYSSKEPVWSN